MPQVVLAFNDCEQWKNYCATQGVEVRSTITLRSARLNANEARTEYLEYSFMMPGMPAVDASHFPRVVEDGSHTYKITCLLHKRYWIVPDEGDVEKAHAKFEFARYDYEKSLEDLARCNFNLDNNLEDSDYFETREDEPDPPVAGMGAEGVYMVAGTRETRIAERQYFQGRVAAYIQDVGRAQYKCDTLRERCANWEKHSIRLMRSSDY